MENKIEIKKEQEKEKELSIFQTYLNEKLIKIIEKHQKEIETSIQENWLSLKDLNLEEDKLSLDSHIKVFYSNLYNFLEQITQKTSSELNKLDEELFKRFFLQEI